MGEDKLYRVYRQYGREHDYALRMVIAEDGTSTRGRYVGIGGYFADVRLPNGQILERINVSVIKDSDDEEQLILGDEAGDFSGVLADEMMNKCRFRFHFNSD